MLGFDVRHYILTDNDYSRLYFVCVVCTYRTPFTKVSRYTYIDTDYRDMDKVVSRKENHKSVYVSYLRQHYAERKWKEKEKYDYLLCQYRYAHVDVSSQSTAEQKLQQLYWFDL